MRLDDAIAIVEELNPNDRRLDRHVNVGLDFDPFDRQIPQRSWLPGRAPVNRAEHRPGDRRIVRIVRHEQAGRRTVEFDLAVSEVEAGADGDVCEQAPMGPAVGGVKDVVGSRN